MCSAKQGVTWKWFYRPLEIPATKKTIHPTTSGKNLETLGKFRTLSFLLFLLLCCCGGVTLQSTSPYCSGKGKSTGVSSIFGKDCSSLRGKRFHLAWFRSKERSTPSQLFYLRHFSRGLWHSFLVLCSYTARKRLLRRLGLYSLCSPLPKTQMSCTTYRLPMVHEICLHIFPAGRKLDFRYSNLL